MKVAWTTFQMRRLFLGLLQQQSIKHPEINEANTLKTTSTNNHGKWLDLSLYLQVARNLEFTSRANWKKKMLPLMGTEIHL